MANVRISSLPEESSPSAIDVVAIDGATTRKATLAKIVEAGRPLANQAEAEAGTEDKKAMTPLTTKQAILAIGSSTFATTAQGALADTAVQPGDLGAVATSNDYNDLDNKPTLGTAAAEDVEAFAPAAQAVPTGGTTGQVLVKASSNDNDVEWSDGGSTVVPAGTKTDPVVADGLLILDSEDDGALKKLAISDLFAASEEAYDPNIALLALEIADLKGDRLGMVDGIADPFDDETDVDTSTSTGESYDSGSDLYSPVLSSTTQGLNTSVDTTGDFSTGFTVINAATALTGGDIIYEIEVYSSSARTLTVKIARDAGTTTWDIVHSQAFSHPGGGWANCVLSSPFTVPGSGSYHVGVSLTGVIEVSSSVSREFKAGDVTGNAQSGFTAQADGGVPPLRVVKNYKPSNMTLVSNAFTAAAEPDTGRIAVQVIENESITVNTDLTAEISRDGGTTWATATLALSATTGTVKLYEDRAVDLSGQPSGTSMKWRVKTLNNKDIDVSGVVLQWR